MAQRVRNKLGGVYMGSVKRNTYNHTLLENANYHNITALKHLIKNYENIKELASSGDGVALSISIDLDTALGIGDDSRTPLTKRQQLAIIYTLIWGLNQHETAEKLGIGQRAVSGLVSRGLQRIKTALIGGTLYGRDNGE